jgi:pimeloyl-ACP methyl ester carboxylesterase
MVGYGSKLLFLAAFAKLCLAPTISFAEKPADLLASFEKQILKLPDGKQMNCHWRRGNGPALVLVPGTWGDIHRFAPLIAELPEDIPIVVVELCWQGGHIPPTLDMSMELLADDVLWAIEKLKLESFYVGGHSIGGMIAVEIAGRDVPSLLGAIPIEGWTHHTVVQTAFNGEVVGKLTPAQEAIRQAGRARGRGHLSDKQLNAISKIWRRWNGFECLTRSQVPILHVWGDRGKPRPNRHALQIPDHESIEIVWIAGASHSLVMEAPRTLAKALMAFIGRTS